jgi:hypothetical protein
MTRFDVLAWALFGVMWIGGCLWLIDVIFSDMKPMTKAEYCDMAQRLAADGDLAPFGFSQLRDAQARCAG